jgi:uncharacterized membrane-anchored protein YjiN (DUF445 family)
MEKKDKYYKEIEERLQAKETKEILETLKDIRKTGHAYILPLLFQLVKENPNQQVQEEVFQMLGQLKEKECVDYVIKEINSEKSPKFITRLLASCWQSGLDYSQHLQTFAEKFVTGDYVTSIEAFTVIEEWIHNTSRDDIQACKKYLVDSISDISDDKKPLYIELVKLFESSI